MKQVIRVGICLSIAFALLAMVPLQAHALTPEERAAALKTRLESRKAEFTTTLTATEQTRLKTRCVAAQNLITTLKTRNEDLVANRKQIHTDMLDRLKAITAKLDSTDVNVAELITETEALRVDIAAFDAIILQYTQAVSDLSEMDCKSDPTAFKASLEAARATRSQLATSAKDIRTQWTTIKAQLATIRALIASQPKAVN
jgi:hypothetical protein